MRSIYIATQNSKWEKHQWVNVFFSTVNVSSHRHWLRLRTRRRGDTASAAYTALTRKKKLPMNIDNCSRFCVRRRCPERNRGASHGPYVNLRVRRRCVPTSTLRQLECSPSMLASCFNFGALRCFPVHLLPGARCGRPEICSYIHNTKWFGIAKGIHDFYQCECR